MSKYGSYINCDGKERELDEFHLHELLDRTHMMQDMFNSYVADHPAAKLFSDDIEHIVRELGKLYQSVGVVR